MMGQDDMPLEFPHRIILPPVRLDLEAIIERFIRAEAPKSINIAGPLRQRLASATVTHYDDALFKEAECQVELMLEAIYNTTFQKSEWGAELHRRASYCGLDSNLDKLINPIPDVSLSPKSVAFDASVPGDLLRSPRSRVTNSAAGDVESAPTSPTSPSSPKRIPRVRLRASATKVPDQPKAEPVKAVSSGTLTVAERSASAERAAALREERENAIKRASSFKNALRSVEVDTHTSSAVAYAARMSRDFNRSQLEITDASSVFNPSLSDGNPDTIASNAEAFL